MKYNYIIITIKSDFLFLTYLWLFVCPSFFFSFSFINVVIFVYLVDLGMFYRFQTEHYITKKSVCNNYKVFSLFLLVDFYLSMFICPSYLLSFDFMNTPLWFSIERPLLMLFLSILLSVCLSGHRQRKGSGFQILFLKSI